MGSDFGQSYPARPGHPGQRGNRARPFVHHEILGPPIGRELYRFVRNGEMLFALVAVHISSALRMWLATPDKLLRNF